MTYEKKTYLPGIVDGYQKPWYTLSNGRVRYYGQFCRKNNPGDVILTFEPLKRLAEKVDDVNLREEMLDMIEEMNDAHYQELDNYISSLPSCD